jgi:integrase
MTPVFGDLPITQITPDQIERWWVTLRTSGLCRKYLGTLRGILKDIFQRGVKTGILQRNPADRIEGRLGKTQGEIKPASDYLTAEDLATFLQTAERLCPTEYPIFLVMATCGLRVGEALGLQAGDLDGPARQLHIRRSVRRGYVDSPKSVKAGVVDVPAATMAVLQEIKEIRQVEAAVNGTEARWMFPSPVLPKRPVTSEHLRRSMRRALLAAGVRKIRLHDLRHTYATLTIQAGVNILNVSRQLRHASIAITADTYAHAVPGGNRAAADVMEAILVGNQAQPLRNPTT